MHFLLSLILSSFFFISPFQYNAGKVPDKQLITNIENNTSTTKLLDYSIYDDYAVAIINSNHHNGSAAPYRFYPFTNFINTAALYNGASFFYDEKHFVLPHLYCKRIGLKLVFPEHYFW